MNMLYNNPLSEKYGEESRWINWRLSKVTTKKGIRDEKKPFYIKKDNTIEYASSTDPSTWSTYEEVSQRLDNGSNNFEGIAVVLDKKLLCIDIDHVVENGTVKHPKSEEILKLIKAANSFTEYSQSGTGLHIFLALNFEFRPIVNRIVEPYEVYTNGRYICTTGIPYRDKKDIRLIETEEDLIKILEVIGYPWGKEIIQNNQIILSNPNISLTNDKILEIMFRAKNGEKLKRLYEGDTTAYDDDESRADMALLSTLAFYSQRNASQMESIWVSSPLGQRKKTQERKDYRDRSIANAIANCKTVYTPRIKEENHDVKFLTQITKTNGEQIISCKENVLIALRITEGLYGRVRRNLWTDKTEIFDIDGKWRPEDDNDINIIQSILSNNYPDYSLRTASETFVRNALLQYAMENAIDPAIEYFKSLVWDGTPRLDTWIKKTYNTEENDEAYKSFGRQWVKAIVKRVCMPGCKFDNVLVLEGPQGLRKSMSLYTLIGKEWHIELTINPNDKDFFLSMQGKMIVEFSEGEIQDRTSTKLLKSVITRATDTYRTPYGRTTKDKPRRCVFAMSVNGDDYLKDDTGNRRWLPVKCGSSINIEWLEENREQILAEAYHYAITLDENLYDGLYTDEIREMQEERRMKRFEETKIVDWYEYRSKEEREEGYTLEEVFELAIGKGKVEEKMNQLHNVIIPPILTNVLKLKKVKRSKDGKRKMLYIPTEETNKKYLPYEESF